MIVDVGSGGLVTRRACAAVDGNGNGLIYGAACRGCFALVLVVGLGDDGTVLGVASRMSSESDNCCSLSGESGISPSGLMRRIGVLEGGGSIDILSKCSHKPGYLAVT